MESLLTAFFETLANDVGDVPSLATESRDRLRSTLKAMGAWVAPGVKLAGALLAPAAAVPLVERFGEAAAAALTGGAELVRGGETAFRARREEVARVLTSLAGEGRPVRVVVLVDDLDRAGPEEVLAMLKLVKLVADLPNVSYVLGMDAERVREILRAHLPEDHAEQYLEKIVQLGVELPPVPSTALCREVLRDASGIATQAGLDASLLAGADAAAWFQSREESNAATTSMPATVVSDSRGAEGWDTWETDGRDFVPLLLPFLTTMRDAVRLVNTFRFALITGEARPDVHPVDLLLLSALQTFTPAVYRQVARNRAFLLREDYRLGDVLREMNRQSTDVRASRMSRLVRIAAADAPPTERATAVAGAAATSEDAAEASTHVRRAAAAFDLLRYLFPHCVEERGTTLDEQRTDRAGVRVCAPEYFSGYFRLVPTAGLLPAAVARAVFAELLRADPDALSPGLVAARLAVRPDWERDSLLVQLVDRAATMTRDEAQTLAVRLPGLLRRGDVLDQGALLAIADSTARTLGVSGMNGSREDGQVAEEEALAFVLAVLAALPPVEAVEYAAVRLKHNSGAEVLRNPDHNRAFARAALDRAVAYLRATPDLFEALGLFEGVEFVADYQLLNGELWQRDTQPEYAEHRRALIVYCDALLAARPGRVGSVIGIVADWTGSPPHMPLAKQDGAALVGRIGDRVDPAAAERAARLVVAGDIPQAPGGASAVDWPALVRTYVAALDAAQEASDRVPVPE